MSRVCPECQSIFGDSVDKCPIDGKDLEDFDVDDDPLVGVVIDGRFRLDELLGAGGMGRVYRATQLSVERPVAIKLLRGEAIPDQQMKERFFREARVISEFSHPNIIRLIDFGNDAERGFPYLVMEMAGGLSLGNLLEEGRLAPELAIEVARQVCSGLLEAHSASIIHRDLKPDNLHLVSVSDGTFHVKILDFGIAFPEEADQNLTATGMMCGTAAYVAPEQARASDIDGQADIYSLGIILFEMLTGVRPFRGESGFEIVMQQVQESPPPIERYVDPSKLPDGLVELIYDLLEKDPRKRTSGPASVRDRLVEIADAMESDPPRLDLTRSDDSLFSPWIFPAISPDEPPRSPAAAGDRQEGEVDPVAPTGAQEGFTAETSPYERNRPLGEGEPDQPADRSGEADGSDPPVRSGRTEIADSDAQRAAASAHTTDVQADNPVRRGLAVAVGGAAALLLVAGGLALWLTSSSEEPSDEAPKATAPKTDSGPEKSGATAANSLDSIDGPLDAYAGRCTVIGDSSEPFHTVYFYPDIGEVILRGDNSLEWSSVEIEGRRGERIVFNYDDGRPAAVRKRSDKRFFTFDEGDEFTCRHEPYAEYYTQLEVRGRYLGGEDGGYALEFPSGGQQFSLSEPAPTDAGPAQTRYVYRVIEGRSGGDAWRLAVRPKQQEQWRAWSLKSDGSDGLPLTRDGNERGYRPKGAPEAQPESTGGTEKADDPDPAEVADHQPRPAPKPEPTAAKPTARRVPPRRPGTAGGGNANGEIPAELQKRIDRLFKKCNEVVEPYADLLRRSEEISNRLKNEDLSKAKQEELQAEIEEVADKLDRMKPSFTAKSGSFGQIWVHLEIALQRRGVPIEKRTALREKYTSECYLTGL